MTLERSLWDWLKDVRLEFGVEALQIERIENMLGAGIPDVEGYFSSGIKGKVSGQFWLELKSKERPARPETPIRFRVQGRELQLQFMRRRWELGGNAFFLLQVGSASERRLYLLPGDLGHLLTPGITEAALCAACCNTGMWTAKTASRGEIIRRAVECRVLQHLLSLK